MNALESIVLGLVQGLSEFLPISSSGHLVIFQAWMGLQNEGLVFEVAVHVATLVSVLVFYRRRVLELAQGILRGQADAWRYAGKLAVATVPAVLLVLVMGDALEAQFERPATTGICLLVTGAILWTTRRSLPRAHRDEPGWGQALLIGCAQAFAILPGISRSGSTVAAALALGVKPVAAAEFSFMMSIVAISGAAARLLTDDRLAAVPVTPLLLGGATALVSGIAAIWLFVRLLQTQAFHQFAYYTWAMGAAFLAWLALAS